MILRITRNKILCGQGWRIGAKNTQVVRESFSGSKSPTRPASRLVSHWFLTLSKRLSCIERVWDVANCQPGSTLSRCHRRRPKTHHAKNLLSRLVGHWVGLCIVCFPCGRRIAVDSVCNAVTNWVRLLGRCRCQEKDRQSRYKHDRVL